MSEINGQLIGVLLVIGIFGVVAAAVTAVVSTLTTAIEEKTNEVAADDFGGVRPAMFTVSLISN